PDSIPNPILQQASHPIFPKLVAVYTAAIRLGYHPVQWQAFTTITLRKPNKLDTLPKAYRAITLEKHTK
ncbi:hypothetical protein BU17DRAFT_51942, partial [Hysterangium stoloniferum]